MYGYSYECVVTRIGLEPKTYGLKVVRTT